MSYTQATWRLFATALLISPFAAHAETVQDICVSSGGDLVVALESINIAKEAGNQADRYRIKIVAGNYFPPVLPKLGSASEPAPSVELIGGYATGCATQGVASTTLNLPRSSATEPLLDIESGADVRIEQLALTPSGPMAAPNNILRIHQAQGALSRARWTIARSEFRGKADENDVSPPIAAMDLRVGAADTPPVTVHVENSVVKGFDAAGCAVQYTEFSPFIPLAGQELEVVNSTIAYNDTCGISASGLERTTRVLLANNIIGLNVGAGLRTTGAVQSEVELHNNMMPAANEIASTVVIDRHNSNANALLSSYALPFPTSASPAVNSGTTYVPGGVDGFDFLGLARWRGSRPDRGAIETFVDDITEQVVTNVNDTGTGSLRSAVNEAGQSPGPDRIVFNILDPQGQPQCPAVIDLASSIVVGDTVRIDGFTQPGSQPNAQARGSNATYCIFVSGGGQNISGIIPASSASLIDIRGIAFGGFGSGAGSAATAVSAGTAEEFNLVGNHFGDGLPNAPAGASANATAASFTNTNGFVIVGGAAAAARNHFVGNPAAILAKSASLRMMNNYFGANRAGNGLAQAGQKTDLVDYLDPKTSFGIESNVFMGDFKLRRAADSSRMIGGAIRKNVFMAGAECLDDPHASCLISVPSPLLSFFVTNAANGLGTVRGLQVEENVFGGSAIVGGANTMGIQPREVALSRNLFRGTAAAFQIQSAQTASNTKNFDNDVAPERDADSNRGQNFPVVQAASGFGGAGQATGQLPTRSGEYVIEVFASNKCHGEFPDYAHGDQAELVGIGSVTVIDNGVTNGTSAFQVPLRSRLGLANRFLYASATDQDGNSSEFSYRFNAVPSCPKYELQAGPDVIFRDGFED